MADKMDIDLPEEHQTPTTTMPPPQEAIQPRPQQSKTKKPISASSTRELTTCTIKSPPFAYLHLSTISLSSSGSAIPPPTSTTNPASGPDVSQQAAAEEEEVIDALQVRSYCTAALQRFLGDTGASIVPDILLVRGSSSSSRKGQADIYLRVPRQDLSPFAAALTAYPGKQISNPGNNTTKRSGNAVKQDGGSWLLLQIQSCGDWLGSLLGKAEEKDIWDRD